MGEPGIHANDHAGACQARHQFSQRLPGPDGRSALFGNAFCTRPLRFVAPGHRNLKAVSAHAFREFQPQPIRVVFGRPGGAVEKHAQLVRPAKLSLQAVVRLTFERVAQRRGEELTLPVDGMLLPRHLVVPAVGPRRQRFARGRGGVTGPDGAAAHTHHRRALHQALRVEHHVVARAAERVPERAHLGTAAPERLSPAAPGDGQNLIHGRVLRGYVGEGFFHHPVEPPAVPGRIGDCRQRVHHISQG